MSNFVCCVSHVSYLSCCKGHWKPFYTHELLASGWGKFHSLWIWLIPNGERKSLRICFCTGQYGKDMPVAYGESDRLLGKVFSLAGDNLEAIVQEINPLPFSILKPWILIQIESFHNSMSRRPSLRTHHGALETRGNFHFFTFSICSTKLPFRDPCSLVAEEKASSSDNQSSPATKGGEFQKR